MRRTAIRSAVLGTAAADVFGTRRAGAAEFSFKVGMDIPEAAPMNVFPH